VLGSQFALPGERPGSRKRRLQFTLGEFERPREDGRVHPFRQFIGVLRPELPPDRVLRPGKSDDCVDVGTRPLGRPLLASRQHDGSLDGLESVEHLADARGPLAGSRHGDGFEVQWPVEQECFPSKPSQEPCLDDGRQVRTEEPVGRRDELDGTAFPRSGRPVPVQPPGSGRPREFAHPVFEFRAEPEVPERRLGLDLVEHVREDRVDAVVTQQVRLDAGLDEHRPFGPVHPGIVGLADPHEVVVAQRRLRADQSRGREKLLVGFREQVCDESDRRLGRRQVVLQLREDALVLRTGDG